MKSTGIVRKVDELGRIVLHAEALRNSPLFDTAVYDKRSGEEVGSIHQKLLTFLPEFEIVIGGRTVGTIRKSFSFLVPRYEVDFRGWEVEGDLLEWDYSVYQGSREVMSISKELFRWGDTYVLRYNDIGDEIPGLLLVIAIDAVNCSKN